MAAYYGQIKGHRSVATRTGTASSGITASVQSWHGSVITRLHDNKIEIEISKDSSFRGKLVFYGTLEELENKLIGGK